jgi:protein-disulfide isomerase
MTSTISNNFTLIIVIALFFLGGFFFGSLWTENKMLKKGGSAGSAGSAPTAPAGADAPSGPSADQLAQMPAVTAEDHVRGNASASVVLVEYSDYECPFCARFHPTMVQAEEEFGDKIAWVYRHYPLPFHPSAQKAAEGSECAAKLGGDEAFWKYTDSLFAANVAQGAVTAETITKSAADAGVAAGAFKTCLDSGEMAGLVTAQLEAGSSAGISGTPGTIVVVDGEPKELIPGALPYEQVKAIIERYL